jgi:hypothetical protein
VFADFVDLDVRIVKGRRGARLTAAIRKIDKRVYDFFGAGLRRAANQHARENRANSELRTLRPAFFFVLIAAPSFHDGYRRFGLISANCTVKMQEFA